MKVSSVALWKKVEKNKTPPTVISAVKDGWGCWLAGASISIDKTDAANPVVKIAFKSRQAELPVNKNILNMADQQIELEGVVVYAEKKGKAYLPLQAIRLIQGDSTTLPAIAE